MPKLLGHEGAGTPPAQGTSRAQASPSAEATPSVQANPPARETLPRAAALETLPRAAALRLGVVVASGALLAACATSGAGPAAVVDGPDLETGDDRIVVATTLTVLADMVSSVGGDRVRVESLTDPGADVHGYEPTVDDLRRAEDADLVVSNGLGLDDWLLRFLDASDARHLVASDGIEPLAISTGRYSGHANPHAWMSPTDGAFYIRAIAAELSGLDPAGAADYTARAEAYIAELDELAADAREAVAEVSPDHRILVTCEGAFSYLARDLGLEELYLWPVNAENQGLPRRVTGLIDRVRDRRVPAVFCESTVSDAAMAQVARDTDSRLAGPLYVDSLSGPDGPVPTYLDLLRHDLATITGELTS